MPDDLDNLLRAAMKTLDEQVPSGYFEALPNQTLARLEGSMQPGSSGTETRDNVAPPPVTAMEPDTSPVAKQPVPGAEREEDSGLHDIRNLAQSTKQRLSKGRITNSPPSADDALASSSGSFKNIALPQPARMVSLPEIDELPSKKEVLAAEKAAKKSSKEKKPEAAEAVPAIKTDLVAMPAPAAAVEQRQAFTLPSQQRKGSKGPLIALVGMGVAAAAGYVIFMQVNKDNSAAPAAGAAKAEAVTTTPAPAATATATGSAMEQPAPPPAPAAEAPPAEPPKDEAATGAAAPAQLATDSDKAEEKTDAKTAHHTAKGGKTAPKSKVDKEQKQEAPKVEVQKPAEKADAKKAGPKAGNGDEAEPNFDALLKEAGVQEKKDTKPKLDKKSLTGDDFKTGMGAVEGKAKACYKGTQGTALVKLTVAPTGKITKINIAGDFAGKPEALCVAAALRGATFPPWDGGPQSFTYAVLLSD